MKVIVTKCQGLNSLGGCHRQETEVVEFDAQELEDMADNGAIVKSNCEGECEIIPRHDCDGWAGCKGGCNSKIYA